MPYELKPNIDLDTNTKENLSFLTPTSFKMTIDKLAYPNVEFTIQTISIPDVSMDGASYATPSRNVAFSGDKVNYAQLALTFIVDEKLKNYSEIHDWILKMANGDTKGINKDITIHIMSSHNNVSKEIQFVDAYPTSVSALPFDVTSTSTEFLVATATFNYSYFKLL